MRKGWKYEKNTIYNFIVSYNGQYEWNRNSS